MKVVPIGHAPSSSGQCCGVVLIALAVLVGLPSGAGAAPGANWARAEPACAGDARERAARLLALQAGDAGAPGSLGKTISVLAPVRNPSDPKQKLDVLAVEGYVIKARYRMRFLYAQVPGQCALLGQEIIELTSY